jgi:hypothetical protein
MDHSSREILLVIDAGSQADQSLIERAGRNLRNDLLQLEVERVDVLPMPAAPAGAKGAGLDWTRMLISVAGSGGLLNALLANLQAWVSRDKERSVTIEISGDKLTVQGISLAEQKRLIDAWLDRHC